ncbi:hypothetical protein ABPG72_021183 [Tetrahymena utriculariae]
MKCRNLINGKQSQFLEIDSCSDLINQKELYEQESKKQSFKVFKDLKQVDIYINHQNFLNQTPLLETLFCSFGKSYLTNDNKYQSPQVIAQRKPYNAQVDIFSIGLLGSEALFQQSLSSQQLLSLQNKNIFKAFPNLQSPNEKEFVQTILCRMLEPVYPQPVQLNQLLQNLKYFNIDESCLVKQEINKYIGFYENQNYDEIENVVKDLENNQRISSLDIYPKKSISIDEVHNIGKILDIGHNISRLNIRLQKIDFESIGISVQHCQNIVSLTLELENNNITYEGIKSLGKSLELCHNLVKLSLNLSGNKITNEGVKNLGRSLESCHNLSSLALSLVYNKLNNEGIRSLGKSLEACQNMNSLHLNLGYFC